MRVTVPGSWPSAVSARRWRGGGLKFEAGWRPQRFDLKSCEETACGIRARVGVRQGAPRELTLRALVLRAFSPRALAPPAWRPPGLASGRPATASSFRLLHSSSCRAGKPQDPRSRRARAHAPVRSVRAHRVRTRRVRSSQCRAKPAVPAAMRRLCSWARLQLQFVAKHFVHELRF